MDPTSLVSSMWHQHQHQQQFPAVGLPPGLVGRGDTSVEGSIVTDQSAGSRGANARRRRRGEAAPPASEDESSKHVSTSSGNDLQTDSEAKRVKVMKSTEENGNALKTEGEADSGADNKTTEQNAAPPELPKQDYIHVRARRGQATDSHSLAERARREKISERMKILQDLVPGCNKVIGKASVLDEIINYIQALQRQVEFLSMKLEAVNSHMNTGIEGGFPSKDFAAQTYNPAPSLAFDTQTPREYNQNSAPEWLHMQVGGAFERVT